MSWVTQVPLHWLRYEYPPNFCMYCTYARLPVGLADPNTWVLLLPAVCGLLTVICLGGLTIHRIRAQTIRNNLGQLVGLWLTAAFMLIGTGMAVLHDGTPAWFEVQAIGSIVLVWGSLFPLHPESRPGRRPRLLRRWRELTISLLLLATILTGVCSEAHLAGAACEAFPGCQIETLVELNDEPQTTQRWPELYGNMERNFTHRTSGGLLLILIMAFTIEGMLRYRSRIRRGHWTGYLWRVLLVVASGILLDIRYGHSGFLIFGLLHAATIYLLIRKAANGLRTAL
ncbi:MAG: hypothetical protein KDK34_06120 [Leptospiraceae bacterium]|nr:hypothetical protein [Leptospiraceae bacterium]